MVWFFPSLLRETFTSLRGSTTLKHFLCKASSLGFVWRRHLAPDSPSPAGCGWYWWAGVVQVEDNWWAARWFATPRETGSPLAVTSPHIHLDYWRRRCRGAKTGEGVDHPNCSYGICRWNNAQGRIRNRGKVVRPKQCRPPAKGRANRGKEKTMWRQMTSSRCEMVCGTRCWPPAGVERPPLRTK